MNCDLLRRFREPGPILMEGALGERLKREYGLRFDPEIAMAALVRSRRGRAALSHIWGEYIGLAAAWRLPILVTTPTRRANRERIARSGWDPAVLRENVAFLRSIRALSPAEVYVGGLMGCKGDAYTASGALTVPDARLFHSWQADRLREAGADFLMAGIMPALPEAVGMAQAMSETGLPYLISFTVQSDGRLIDGAAISEAIAHIDQAAERPPVCYMANCVHPDIVLQALAAPCNAGRQVRERFWGIQANTSPLPYAELDGAADLKSSEPEELARSMLRLRETFGLRLFGGCCGTDGRHMAAIARGLCKPESKE